MEHELELKRLKEQETLEKRAKGIALKTTLEHDISEEEENPEHDETLSVLSRKFSIFLVPPWWTGAMTWHPAIEQAC